MRDLVRSSSLLAFRQALIGGLGVIRTKVVAVLLGPAGVGLVAQASQLAAFSGRLANLGLGNGVAKYTAQYEAAGASKDLEALLGSVRWAVTAASVLVVVLLVGGQRLLAGWVFGAPRYRTALLLVAVATPFAAQGDAAAFALRGARQFRAFALAGLAVAGAAVVITVSLVLAFGVDGAFWAIPATAIVTCVVLRGAFARAVLRPLGVRDRLRVPERALLMALLAYGLAVLASGLSDTGGELVVRSSLVHRLGTEANGFYHASWNVGSQFNALLGSSLATWGLPAMASLRADARRVNEVRNDLLRAYLLASVPLAVVGLLSTSLWIPLLFSGRFLPAAPLLSWQLAATVVLGVRVMLNTSLWAHGRLGVLTAATLSQTAVYLGLYFLLVGSMGVRAVPVAFFWSQVTMLVPTVCYLWVAESMRLDRETAKVALTSAAMVGIWLVALTDGSLAARALVGTATLGWMAANVRVRDVRALWHELHTWLPAEAKA
jgi:enterobacterial common antigen flippase